MAEPSEFKNILVIHFGQLGDVVLGVPALNAIREKFHDAHITVAAGRATAEVIRLGNVADDVIEVDRVAMRDGSTTRSLKMIWDLLRDVRSRRFDLVIDLHSLYETNLLGWLSGAPLRLYSRRENRTLEWLNNYPLKPRVEDKNEHHTDRFLAVIEPLGISPSGRQAHLTLDEGVGRSADDMLASKGLSDKRLIGLFLGAGHPTRKWPIDNFVHLARELSDRGETVLMLLGPEERDLRPGLQDRCGEAAAVVDELPLRSFIALLSRLDVLVSGDTGPMHLAAATGAGVVLLAEKNAPDFFLPRTERLVVLRERPLVEITVDEAVRGVLRLVDRAYDKRDPK